MRGYHAGWGGGDACAMKGCGEITVYHPTVLKKIVVYACKVMNLQPKCRYFDISDLNVVQSQRLVSANPGLKCNLLVLLF